MGYADDHGEGIYQMFNLKTQRIWTTKDVTWMNCNIVVLEHHKTNWEATQGINRYDDNYDPLPDHPVSAKNLQLENKQNDEDDNNNDDSEGGSNNASQDETTSVTTTESDRATAQILQEMHCLSSWFNPIANEVIKIAEADEVIENAVAGAKESSENSNAATHQSGREVAHAMIESLPSQFAFYVKTGVIDTNLNFNDAYRQIPIKPMTFHESYNHSDPKQ